MRGKRKHPHFRGWKPHIALTICAMLPVLVSYFNTWQREQEWIRQLQQPAADLNIAAAQELVNGYCGLSYITDFLFFDAVVVFVLLMAISIGWIMTMRSGSMRSRKHFICELLHTAVFTGGFLMMLTLATVMIVPSGGIRPVTTKLYLLRQASGFNFALIIGTQILLVTAVVTLLVALAWTGMRFFRRRVVAIMLPIGLVLLMQLVVSVVGWLIPMLRFAVEPLLLSSSLLALYTRFAASGMSISETLLHVLCLPCLCALLCFLLYQFSRQETSHSKSLKN